MGLLCPFLSRQYEPGNQPGDIESFEEPADHGAGGRLLTRAEVYCDVGTQQVRPRDNQKDERAADQPGEKPAAARTSLPPRRASRERADSDSDASSRNATTDAEG